MKILLIIMSTVVLTFGNEIFPFKMESEIEDIFKHCDYDTQIKNRLDYYMKNRKIKKDELICSLLVIAKSIEPDPDMWDITYYKNERLKNWLKALGFLGNKQAINTYKKLLRNKDRYIVQFFSARLLFEFEVPWYSLCESIISDTINIHDDTRCNLYDVYIKEYVIDKYLDTLVNDSVMTLLCYALKTERDPYNSTYADILLSFLSPNDYRYSKERRKVNIKIASHEKLDIIKKKSEVEFQRIIMRTKEVLSIPEEKLHQSERFKECLGY